MDVSELNSRRLRWFRKQRSVAMVLIPIGMILSVVAFKEYYHSRPAQGAALVSGTVIQRSYTRIWGVAKRPQYEIKINGSETIVKAILFSDSRNSFRDGQVTFYYSGDPAKEVFIEGETSPLWFAALLMLAPPMALIISVYAVRKQERILAQNVHK